MGGAVRRLRRQDVLHVHEAGSGDAVVEDVMVLQADGPLVPAVPVVS
mgnify:CR=1 FL=1